MKLKTTVKGFVAMSVLLAQVGQASAQTAINVTGISDDTPPIVIRTTTPKPAIATATARARSNTAKSTNSMSGVEESLVPGITCPLVENRPHTDLLAAIENLNRHVKTAPNCKDNGDAEKMSQITQSIQKSGAALQGYWNNPDVLSADPAKLLDFQKHMENVVAGIDGVGQALSSNSLLKTECGKSLTGKTSVLLAFSDLATSLAPMALLGASLNPSWSVALKVILGVVGVGSTAKILASMYDEGTLDMDIPENRLAVLQNTCEFSRIAQRVRFLKLAQSGQINQVTQEIKMYRLQTDSALRINTSDRVLEMLAFRNDVTNILNDTQADIIKDNKAIATSQSRVKMDDENLVCMFSQELVAHFDDAKTFPARPVSNLEKLVASQDEISFDQEFLLKSEKALRTKIKAQVSASSAADITKCATNGKSYVSILANIVNQTAITMMSHRASLRTQLSKDKEFAKYQQQEIKAYREVDTLTKIGSVLERLNQDNSVIDKSEMHQQMAALKYALFNSRSRMPWGPSSPVMSWLKHANTMYAESMGRFTKEMSALIFGAQGITKTGNTMPMPPRSDFNNEEYFKKVSQYLKDTKQSTALANVTLKLAPVGSSQNTDICRHLENTWLEWASALDHLASEAFFCKTISNLMDQTVEQEIKDHCYGKVDFAGKVQIKSMVAEQQSRLVENGAKAQAQLVSKKLKELQCEMPDPASAMN